MSIQRTLKRKSVRGNGSVEMLRAAWRWLTIKRLKKSIKDSADRHERRRLIRHLLKVQRGT